jgi:hypothetical protein
LSIPICEVCQANEATSLSHFFSDEKPRFGEWKLACSCTASKEDYYIEFVCWNANNNWLDHMREKNWFDEVDFLQCVNRAGLTLFT